MRKMTDLTDRKFGRLTAKRPVGSNKYKKMQWLCECACGNYKIILGNSLLAGLTQSCGCLKGDGTSNMTIHLQVARSKPKSELCERCRERSATELSYNHSLTEAQKFNPNNYEWLCTSCHRLKDGGRGTIVTKARIHRIREFYKCRAADQRELARLFKVSQRTIANILHYRGAYQETSIINVS